MVAQLSGRTAQYKATALRQIAAVLRGFPAQYNTQNVFLRFPYRFWRVDNATQHKSDTFSRLIQAT